MQRYIMKRLGQALVTVFGVSIIVFMLVRLSGDPSMTMLPPDASLADRALFRQELGLDRPLTTQYALFLANAVGGDLGKSILDGQPALPAVLTHLRNTLKLVAFALALAVGTGVTIGVWSAVRPGGFVDRFGRYFAILGQSAPTFWVGIMLVLIFSLNLRLLPTSGKAGILTYLMPGFTLGWFSMAAMTRLSHSAMRSVLGSDYITMARALGTPHKVIVFKYALKNAAILVLTMASIQLITLIGGTVIVETIFAWPGVGRLAVNSIFARDYPVVQAFTLVFALLATSINLVVDILYAYIDPRVRFEGLEG